MANSYEYDEIYERVEDKKTKSSIFSYFSGIKPAWLFLGIGLIIVFLYWYNQRANIPLSPWIPVILLGGALLIIGIGQNSQEIKWVTREEAEALGYKAVKEEQREIYTDLPDGDIVITKLGGTDYEKTTWFIPYFVMDKVISQPTWRVARVDCWGKRYLGSFRLKDDEVPTGKESGFFFKPRENEYARTAY